MRASGASFTVWFAGRSTAFTADIFMMPPSIFMLWISTTAATGLAAATRPAARLLVTSMNAPVPFCPETVPRIQAPFTSTDCAATGETPDKAAVRAITAAIECFFMDGLYRAAA